MNRFIALVALALLAVPAAAQAQTTKTKIVPATALVENGNKPDDPGNCSAISFVRWKDVPGLKVTSALAQYTFDGQPATERRDAPFDDTYDWVKVYTTPPGTHQIAIGKSWADGAAPDDCSGMAAKSRSWLNPVATVELTYDNTVKCTAQSKKADKARRAVEKAQARLRSAKSRHAKAAARRSLKKNKATFKRAQAGVEREC